MEEQKGLKSGVAMVCVSGATVRSLRMEQDLTQLYLATAVGVTTETISRWERSEAPTIKRENGLKLAEALSVPLEEILVPAAKETAAEEPEEVLAAAPVQAGKKQALLITAVLAVSLLFFFLYRQGAKPVQVSARRTMPAHTVSGQSFPVVIDVHLDAGTNASFLVTEELPPGCRVIRTVPATAAASETSLKWIEKNGTGKRSFAYLASCGTGAETAASLSFSGVLLVRRVTKKEIPVTGRDHLQLAAFHWADANRDTVIDDQELLAVYDDFARIESLGVDVDEVENIWMASGYRWNGKEKLFEPVP